MATEVFTSEDASAPASFTPALGEWIILLDAVLINGYGSKTAVPGWTKPFTGTNKAAYLSPDGVYLRVDHSVDAARAEVLAYTSMTDVDTGAEPFGQLPGYWGAKSTGTGQWAIYANDGLFYTLVNHTVTNRWFSAGFGKFNSFKIGDAHNYFISAQDTSGNFGLVRTNASHNRFKRDADGVAQDTALSKTFLGGQLGSDYTVGNNNNVVYPDPVSGALHLSHYFLTSGLVHPRGLFPGLWSPAFLQFQAGADQDTFQAIVGGVTRDFIIYSAFSGGTEGRLFLETSDTWDLV